MAGRAGRDDIGSYAAALSYSALFSLPPLLLFASSLLGWAHLPSLGSALSGPLRSLLPGRVRASVEAFLSSSAAAHSPVLLPLTGLGYVWGMSGAFRTAIDALNHAYELPLPYRRPLWRTYALSLVLSLTVGVALVAVVALITVAADWLQAVVRLVSRREVASAVIEVWRWSLAVSAVYASVAVLYARAPDRPRPLRLSTAGTAVALAGWLALSAALSAYAQRAAHWDAWYGTLGGVIFLLLYLYLCALAFLVGAEVDAVCAEHGASGAKDSRLGQPALRPGTREGDAP